VDVKEAEAGDEILHGTVLIAEGGHDLTVAKNGHSYFADLNRNGGISRFRPSIDRMMASTAEHFRERAIGVIMTGMCSDGVRGVREIKEKQGRVIAQDEETSAVYGMNKLAVQSGVVDQVVPLCRIVPTVMEMLEEFQEEGILNTVRTPGPARIRIQKNPV
jgi:two-component system chemotaxis response regulator CheB